NRLRPWLQKREDRKPLPASTESGARTVSYPSLHAHAIIIGYGRVGRLVGASLQGRDLPFVVLESEPEIVQALREQGVPALCGNGAAPGIMQAANIATARWLIVAIPDALEAGQVIEHARKLNPQIEVVARAHSDAQLAHLERHG